MTRFEILDGLPPYGSPATAFSATGHGTHSEGLVVRFCTPAGEEWVGNFVRGFWGCSTAIEHPNGNWVIIVSGGQGYIVDPDARSQVATLNATIQDVIKCTETNTVIFGDGLGFEAIGSDGLVWRTRRIAWGDGTQNIRLENGTLLGEAYDPMADTWTPFAVDAHTGKQIKGAWVSKENEILKAPSTERLPSKVGQLWLLTVPVLVATGLLFACKPIEIARNDWLDIILIIAVIAFVSLGAAMFLTAIALTGIRLFKPDAKILTSSKRIALIIAVLSVLFLVVTLWMAMADIDRLRSHPRIGTTDLPSCYWLACAVAPRTEAYG